LKKDERYVLVLALFVSDYSLNLTNQVAKVLLVDDGTFFKGVKVEDVLNNKKKDAQERVWRTLHTMLKFNVCVESCLVATQAGQQLAMADSEIKEYF
jgi:hypothetical protein